MNTIKIPRHLANQIMQHAQSDDLFEVCGLISEKNGEPFRLYPVMNVAEKPARFYQMDGREQIEAMKKMRENDESLFAIYHSHPSSEAYPSKIDIEQSEYPDAIYFIVSLDTKGVLDLRAFKLKAGDIVSLAVTL